VNEEQMREELKKAYPHSDKWKSKVDEMSARQVSAIFIRLRAQGKLGK
jgi:ABC-type phosphate transport system auxiliary subunit